jgi:hypothetical protein
MAETFPSSEETTAWQEQHDPLAPKERDLAPDFELRDVTGGSSFLDEFARLSEQAVKRGGTLLLDYLEALGEGVILAAQWIYERCRK